MSGFKSRLKTRVAQSFEKAGLTVTGYGHANCLRELLKARKIETTFDIGANVGQYAEWLRGVVGYRGQIISVEPSSAAHQQLSQKAAGDPAWTVATRCAVGSAPGEATLNVSGNSVSSSILPITEGLGRMVDAARAVQTEVVPVRTMADLHREYGSKGRPAFLKVDTQGFERAVIDGIGDDWDTWPVVQLELSVVALYRGETGFTDMLQLMESRGYQVHGLFPSFWTNPEYRLIQADCLFVRGAAENNV